MKQEIKTFLIQALKLQNNPPYSQVKTLIQEVQKSENIFLNARRGKKVEILNEQLLFEFISETTTLNIHSFKDIENILNSSTKEENIKLTTNSKSTSVTPFNRTMLIKKNTRIMLYQEKDIPNLKFTKLVAVENSESFLKIEGNEVFIYLSGNPNRLIREFLKDKEVKFFIDLDIISLNLYEKFESKLKTIFIPDNFDELLEKYGNQELYLKQRRFLKEKYPLTQTIIDKIARCNKVLEQEVINYDSH